MKNKTAQQYNYKPQSLTLQKGEDLTWFAYITKTSAGVPTIKFKHIDMHRIKAIEISSVGKEWEYGIIKKVRVTGDRADGKGTYVKYYKGVYISFQDTLEEDYTLECTKYYENVISEQTAKLVEQKRHFDAYSNKIAEYIKVMVKREQKNNLKSQCAHMLNKEF